MIVEQPVYNYLKVRVLSKDANRTNRVLNPSFTKDVSNWTQVSGTLTWDGTDGYIGFGCARHVSTSTGQFIRSSFIAASAGQSFTASAYIRGAAGKTNRILVQFFDSGSTLLSSDLTDTVASGVWERVSVAGVAPTNTAFVAVSIANRDAAGQTLVIDNVLLERSAPLGEYFDGYTVNNAGVYAWSGTPDASASVQYLWTEILAEGTSLSMTRGGALGLAGVSSVDVGSLNLRLLNVYDPAVVNFLEPEMIIQAYIDDAAFATPDDGAVFTGKIDDIDTEYEIDRIKGGLNTFVNIVATDAVQSHAGITVNGVICSTLNGTPGTANGYQRWEDRIEDLAPLAAETVEIPEINATVTIYSI